ncbi:HNH endonuclease [Paenibacillus alkaliterrae]|uniref:HNH endonuclease signature motif containing protein n=1 Tax=Paenibacillus alkaliterrae TaxID=320909 RepID=UPI001F2DFA12|nr:HNH endonuclease signature motif containing protein [Paenibacillus alkaliterrae]MCF2938935.1 HNH endonuclease [Paenibacillus alkaliterrae]
MESLPKRFSEKIDFSGDCWLWKACIYKNGYGHYYSNKKHVYAHRYSYTHFYGDIPDGMNVLHECDVRNCVNPRHLSVGTQSKNLLDMYKKGRSGKRNFPVGDDHWSKKRPDLVKRGESNNKAKVTPDIVREIRNSYRRGTNRKSDLSYNGLAKKYGLTINAVREIVLRNTWTHVE